MIHRHEAGLQQLAYRVLGDHGHAEEVVQDSFYKLSQNGVIARPDEEVAAWLRRVTLNGAFNRLRSETRAANRHDRAGRLEVSAAEPDTPLAEVVAAEERALVRRVLAELPERQRVVLLLRAAGCSYAEVAAAVGVAPTSTGTLLARAERAFRHTYESLTPRLGEIR